MKRSILVLLLAAAVCVPALAQTTTGSIRGTVTDPSGQAVAEAGVTVLNGETGLSRSTVTNTAGRYAFSNLPVGTYLVTVEVEGFKTVLLQNIVLNVADDREANAQLELGELAEEMTVTSSSLVVETIGGEVAGLITGEQVRELPLNGRNFLQLTQLMPGVSAPDGFNTKNKGLLTGSDLSVSGGGVTANLFTVDGANNNDVGSNRTVLVYPSVEAIEEFKIHRNAYGAEFGGAGGAQVNLVTRGGTNQLQGSVFYFKRDDAWNTANLILRRANAEKEPLDRDDYGYTLGGALKKDRLHFFLSQEFNDEVRGVARSALVPTAAEKQGDFSQSDPNCSPTPIDPLTGQPFPGNVIPADRLSEAGLLYMQLYPDANTSIPGSCTNWVEAVGVPIDWDQINFRSDWTVTDSTRAMLRYTEDDWINPGPSAGGENGLWGDDPFPAADSAWAQPSESLVAQLNSVIGSSAINTVTFSMSGNEINIAQAGDVDLINRLNAAFPSFFPASGKTADNLSHPLFWGGGGYPTLWSISPWQNDMDITILKDDWEQVFGNHVVKAGFLYSDNSKLEWAAGSFQEAPLLWGSFPGSGTGVGGWGANTGNTVADFLLKDMFFGFSEQSFNPVPDIQWEDQEFYVADSWKIRPNMTLDYGIRYSRFKEPYHADSTVYTMFDPATFDPALGNMPCNGIVFVPGNDPCADIGGGGTPGPNKALINSDSDNFAPRLGFAWDLNGDGESVVRVGFGQFFQRERVSPQLGFLNNPGNGVQFAGGIRSLDGDIRPDFVATGGLPAGGFDPNADTPYMLQYNVSWERRLGRDSTIEVGYVASRGRHLLRSNDINQVPTGDPNGNGIPDRLEHARCPGGDGGAGCRSAFRPFGVFGDRNIAWWTTDGKSDYDSIQTQYTLRYGRGSQVQTSYTLSDFKADQDVGNSSGGLGVQSTTDLANPSLDYGPAALDREHIFNASVLHNLPSFEGVGGFKEHFLGNWSVGGIVIYSSGVPLTITAADPGGPLQGEPPHGTGFDDNFRPIRTGESCSGAGGAQFLNPNAFTLTGYVLGETSQMARRGACTGPDFFQVDFSLYKNIPVRSDRVNIQLRIEAFNIFNTNNYTGVDTNWGGSDVTLDGPLESATTITGANPSPTFGTAFGARDPRQFQLGLKVSF